MRNDVIRGLTARQLLNSLTHAFTDHFKPKDTIVVEGKERTAEWLADYFQNGEQAFAKVELAKSAHTQAVQEREKAIPSLVEYGKHALASLEVHWGSDPEKLTQVGIPPKKKTKRELTSEQKFLAAEKRKKTREARGTMGRRQRELIKGAPVEVVVVPRAANPDATQAGAQTQRAAATSSSTPAPASQRTAPTGGNVVVPSGDGTNPVSGT